MNLVLELRFRTAFGQQLFVFSQHPLFGGGDVAKAIPMRFKDINRWELKIGIPDDSLPEHPLSYNYVLREPDGSLVYDWPAGRELNLAAFGGQDFTLVDSWNNTGFHQNSFYTGPFQEVLLKPRRARFIAPPAVYVTHRFCVKAPLLKQDEVLCLLGSASTLGSWDTTSPLLMNRQPENPECWVDAQLPQEHFPLEYKYGVFNLKKAAFVHYETGANRVLPDPPDPTRVVLVRDTFAALPSTPWKGAGVTVPVFSLRSERSFGIGEFRDLAPLADWCLATGLQLIQVLPVNDTTATRTWRDSYPYAAISAFALHPVYLCLEQVVTTTETQRTLKELETERERLNALMEVDFESVLKAKLGFLRQIFPIEKTRILRSPDYEEFVAANSIWLIPYAVFCALRDRFNTSDFNQWPSHSHFDPRDISNLASGELRDEVELSCFTQYHLHIQLRQAASHAHERGVVLKGDIPIGIFGFGADAWQAPENFNMDIQAGAPPDAFSDKGQNWGFPTYKWRRMQEDGYAWWKMRLTQMSRYFDAFRIDHILGFFRIWSIPRHAVEGILGHFVPALPVHRSEFEARGIPFDRDLYLHPRITSRSLDEHFGPQAGFVAREFLEAANGQFRLKEQFQTQRQIERHFADRTDRESRQLRNGLYDLVADVLLFEESAAPDAFHFRFGIESVSVFKELPIEVQARLKDLYVDYFFRRQDAFWMREALEKLPALKRATRMLVCGEDLGMVPACVPQVMRDLGLLSLEIQRMPKDPAHLFFRPVDAPYLSVVTPSTHDMSTIRGWWEEDPRLTQRFYNEELLLGGTAPRECTAEINMLIVRQHLSSPAMWSIFQIQDLLGTEETLRRTDPHEERINVPANPGHYWRYRMHLTLEQLLAEGAFNRRINQAVIDSGRAPERPISET